MEWADRGIVLSARRHGETSAVVSVLTAAHGRHAGLVRGAKRAGGTFEPGNLVSLRWRARLEDHLGNYAAELVHSCAAAILDDPLRLAALAAACALADSALPERESHEKVFQNLVSLLALLESGRDEEWRAGFVRFELDLLRDLGFGIDLSRCAVTGTPDNLAFVSPKTGRAVSREAAAPYRDKLLPLPAFLVAESPAASCEETLAGLALTGHFLEQHVYAPHNRALPAARARLIDRLGASAKVAPDKETP